MEGGGLYQIRSKEEEHAFRVSLFFFLSIFLEGNRERASRGWEGSWKDHMFWSWKKRILLLLKNIFPRLYFLFTSI